LDPFLQLLLVAGLVVLLVLAAAATVAVLVVRRDARRRIQAARITAMGTAVGRILHQIQNPLQGLLLQTERLRSPGAEASPDLMREAAGAILDESERVNEFLTELRLYASGAARRPELYAMDLGGLAHSVVRRRSLEKGTGVRVVFSGDQPLPVQGDAYLLDQCVENLVKNAQEAIAENDLRGEVRVSALRKGGMATILVEDDGPGLRDDQLLNIFEPFHTTRSRGMGLGLPICRDVAHAHGGTLQAGKGPGGGALFVLALPLREGAGEG
jgi:two-component system, LuxR family, sensor histidine kinase TtrS